LLPVAAAVADQKVVWLPGMVVPVETEMETEPTVLIHQMAVADSVLSEQHLVRPVLAAEDS
jgi:hypothetical protein